ncbi:MAG TPA: hypothetical protein VD998_03750 [Verrucomicrobiae bacterium]|nr:hypothetical protein [Verrucomicrobiae bacterium]
MSTRENMEASRWAFRTFFIITLGIIAFFLKSAYADLNETKTLVQKHEALFPGIEKRMDKMDDKLDKILLAVKS